MSPRTTEIVRQPLAVANRSRRRWDQHLVRFPRVVAFVARVLWRIYLFLPPRSRLRRAMLRTFVGRSFEALNRGDFEATFTLYHADVESIMPPELSSLGIEPVFQGRKARVDFQERWNTEWGNWWFEGKELIDLGDDRVLITGFARGSGSRSGAVVGNECAFLFTVSGGQAIRERIFLDHDEAFKAAGLR